MERSFESSLAAGARALEALAIEAERAGLAPSRLEHDPRWLCRIDHGPEASGAALVMRRHGALVAYVPLRRRRVGLRLRLGEVAVPAPPLRVIELFGEGIVGDAEASCEAVVRAIERLPEPYDAVLLDATPTRSPLWKHLEQRGSGSLTRFDRGRSHHHVLALPESFDRFLASLSSRERNNLTRRARRMRDELGEVRIASYASADDVAALLAVVGPIASRAFHGRLLGLDLSADNARLRDNWRACASLGALRAFVLEAGGRPAAYEIGFVVGRRFFGELTGYDPALAKYGPGIAVVCGAIERLLGAREVDSFDFGTGGAEYKQSLGARVCEDGAMLLVRPTAYARGVAHAERLSVAASRRAAAWLDERGYKRALKRLLREHWGAWRTPAVLPGVASGRAAM